MDDRSKPASLPVAGPRARADPRRCHNTGLTTLRGGHWVTEQGRRAARGAARAAAAAAAAHLAARRPKRISALRPGRLTFGVQPLRVEPSICNRSLRVSGLVATGRKASEAKPARDGTYGG